MGNEIEFERDMDPDFFYYSYRPNYELWRDQAIMIGRKVGLSAKSFRAFTAGVNLVATIDDVWVIKIVSAPSMGKRVKSVTGSPRWPSKCVSPKAHDCGRIAL